MKSGINPKASEQRDRSRRIRPLQSISLPDGEARSLQERLYHRLRELIRSQTFPKGSRLASSRTLAASLGISRNSVLTAIDRLIADGWLESRRNSGVYVVYSGKPFAAQTPNRSQSASVTFQLGWPTHLFPVRLWTRLQMRRWRDMPDLSLQQGERLGLPALRKAIAAYLTAARGLPCNADQVVVTTSIPAGVELAVQALDLSGTKAWVEDPCCQTPLEGLHRTNVRLAPVPVDDQGIMIDAGKAAAPDARIALIGPSCQAPTGVTLSGIRRQAILDWAGASGSWIFEDDFNYRVDPKRPLTPPLAALDRSRVLYFNSFNSLLFPGLRIAYIVVPAAAIGHFEATRGFEGEVNAPNQMVLTDFLEAGYFEEHLRHLDASDAERRSVLLTCVNDSLSDYLVPQNNAGEYFICTLKKSSEAVVTQAATAAGIKVTPMSEYRRLSADRQEIILGYSQHHPAAIAKAAIQLRSALERISSAELRSA